MKIKIVGFKVGVARPVYDRTIEYQEESLTPAERVAVQDEIGYRINEALQKSDFLSVRKV